MPFGVTPMYPIFACPLIKYLRQKYPAQLGLTFKKNRYGTEKLEFFHSFFGLAPLFSFALLLPTHIIHHSSLTHLSWGWS